MPEHVSAALRRLVRARAQGRCECCLTPEAYAPEAFSVEHILPRSKRGESTADNLALSCPGCNNHKFTRTRAIDAVTELAVALYHPRQQTWQEHFAWLPDADRERRSERRSFDAAVYELASRARSSSPRCHSPPAG